ncbi:Tim10/DDP family zinc finger-domain-containing protein [Hyaloscypha finlandica]|nr:Tim10/DDP family zinc finger-domain-containing protein [Hyaloscypha finlandica]
MDNISNGLGFGTSASDPKAAVMNQVRQEAAMTNARQLIEKVNEHCFEKCVPKPGSSLSSGETTCFTQCMEKYMAAWNTVSRQYINRIQQEQGRSSGGGGIF